MGNSADTPQFAVEVIALWWQTEGQGLYPGKQQLLILADAGGAMVADLGSGNNGVGFAAGEALDLPGLLAHKHFGLAGMFERAALIDAQVSIESKTGAGTQVRVGWEKLVNSSQ